MSVDSAVAGSAMGSSPLSGLNALRSRRASPLYTKSAATRTSLIASTSDVPSSRPNPAKVSFQSVDADDSDDDEHDSPVLSSLAQKLLENENGGAGGQADVTAAPTTMRYQSSYGKTPDWRSEKKDGQFSGSSNERTRGSPPLYARETGHELVTPAPRSRTRRAINAYHSSAGSSASGKENQAPHETRPETERKPSYSSLHASVSRPTSTATASAMRWRRPAALASVPRRGPWMDTQTYQDQQDQEEREEEAEEEKEESPRERRQSPVLQQQSPEIRQVETVETVERRRSPVPQRVSPSGSYEGLKRRSFNSIVARRSPAISPVNSKEGLSALARSRSPSHEIKKELDTPSQRAPSAEYRPQLELQSATHPDSPTPIKHEPAPHHTGHHNSNYNKENIAPAPPPVFNISAAESYKKPMAPPIKKHSDSQEHPHVLQRRSANTPLRPAPPPPPKMSIIDTATAAGGASAIPSYQRQGSKPIVVNNRRYTKLDRLGKGGSGKVYRVMAESEKLLALKRVNFGNVGSDVIEGYKREIQLLYTLKDEKRIVTLFDHEINDRKGYLTLIMECGEASFAQLLASKYDIDSSKLDLSFVRHYWREMLLCVQAVHRHDIVHSDLKPANFVIVQGRLKLIDFGIADAIPDDTVNVHREAMVGTSNYMSPEALNNTLSPASWQDRGPKLIKIGPASDIWSLGCILYQMVYGQTPFAHVKDFMAKIQAIISPDYEIEFPDDGIGGVMVPKSLIRVMKMCLERDKTKRATMAELLSEKEAFLNPDRLRDGYVDISIDTLGALLESVVKHYENNGKPDREQIQDWAKDVYVKLDRKMAEAGVGRR